MKKSNIIYSITLSIIAGILTYLIINHYTKHNTITTSEIAPDVDIFIVIDQGDDNLKQKTTDKPIPLDLDITFTNKEPLKQSL